MAAPIIKKVAVSGKKGAGKYFIVDSSDYTSVSQYRWHLRGSYLCRKETINGVATIIYLHKSLLNVPKEGTVDHINRDPLDNRRCNLRACTPQQNAANKRLHSNNTSGFKGVWWNKQRRKWTSTLRSGGKRYYLGYFTDPIEAAKAYDKVAKEIWGDYARPNI